MSSRFNRSLVFLGVVCLAACARAGTDDAAQETATMDSASAPAPITQQEVETLDAQVVNALHAADGAAAGAAYAADATFISARGKVDGRDAITAFWTNATKSGAGKSLELHPLKWGTSGDLAWSLYHYTGGITAPTGHVIAVSQRQPDGSVKILAQVSIPETAAAK